MKEIEVITLEDNIEYAVVDEIVIDNENYIYLVNVNDEKDFCIRKMKETETERHIIGLETNEEFFKALAKFQEKYTN